MAEYLSGTGSVVVVGYTPAAFGILPGTGAVTVTGTAATGFGYNALNGSVAVSGYAAEAFGVVPGAGDVAVAGQAPQEIPLSAITASTVTSLVTLSKYILLTATSSGTITSVVQLDKYILLAALSALSVASVSGLSVGHRLQALSHVVVSSLQSFQLATGADLPAAAAAWAINLDTSASAQYDNYGFNSFFRRGQDYFGVANDGIYKLSGPTDAGDPIDALAAFVRSSLGVQAVKHVPSVYVGAASDGALILRVDADGIVRYYKARTTSSNLQQHRVDVGRGARGVYWEFELMNTNGEDFEIADMTLLPVVADRRI